MTALAPWLVLLGLVLAIATFQQWVLDTDPDPQGPAAHGRKVVGLTGKVVVRWLPALVGMATALVALDWGLGAAWDRVTTESPSSSQVGTVDLAGRRLPPTADPRVNSPALADAAWANRYYAELDNLPYTYIPFVGAHERAVHGRYINATSDERRSWEPNAAADGRVPVVWFFGGSTLWGEGQRDGHTIPSEVARIAATAGEPIRVVNYGERGYTALQELLVFEREVTRHGPPDLAVFYHGYNELSTQIETPQNLGNQPTVFQLSLVERSFLRAPPLPGRQVLPAPSVARQYLDTSATTHLLRRIAALASIRPAVAAESGFLPSREQMAEAVADADDIYRRTVRLIGHVAAVHDVPTAMFWQPAGPLPYDGWSRFTAKVASVGGAVDLSHVLDDPPAPVYIDGIHTNELGARLVAEAMWPTVARRLAEEGR